MFFFFKQNTPSTNHQKKRSKVAIFQINSFQQFSKRSFFSFPVYQQICAKASPNNRDKFGRFSNHSGYDLTLVSESLTFCKSANKTPPTGRFRVIRFSTKRSTFYCIILASRSHPTLLHEGRTSIPAITGYTAGAGYARPMQALALASRASPDLVSGLCPVSVRSARLSLFRHLVSGLERSSELRSVQEGCTLLRLFEPIPCVLCTVRDHRIPPRAKR